MRITTYICGWQILANNPILQNKWKTDQVLVLDHNYHPGFEKALSSTVIIIITLIGETSSSILLTTNVNSAKLNAEASNVFVTIPCVFLFCTTKSCIYCF